MALHIYYVFQIYRKIPNIRRSQSPNLNVSRLVLQLSFAQSNEAWC